MIGARGPSGCVPYDTNWSMGSTMGSGDGALRPAAILAARGRRSGSGFYRNIRASSSAPATPPPQAGNANAPSWCAGSSSHSGTGQRAAPRARFLLWGHTLLPVRRTRRTFRKAVPTVRLSPAADVRQQAFRLDWCQASAHRTPIACISSRAFQSPRPSAGTRPPIASAPPCSPPSFSHDHAPAGPPREARARRPAVWPGRPHRSG